MSLEHVLVQLIQLFKLKVMIGYHVKKELPEKGVNVILTFKDTFHTHPSWPKIQVLPAWICNVDDDNPKGQWAIEGRLGNYVINIDDGIAWKPLPEPYKGGRRCRLKIIYVRVVVKILDSLRKVKRRPVYIVANVVNGSSGLTRTKRI